MSLSSIPSQFLRDLILDQAIATVSYTEAERQQFCQQLYGQKSYQDWLQQQGVTLEQSEDWINRELKILKFQQQQWGGTLSSYFLQRKHQIDQVICSLIYLSDREMAQELYFRIAEAEQSFFEVARAYSQGAEAQLGGRVGPIELGKLHPDLARLFYGSRPGHLWEPRKVGKWLVIARLEESLPVRLDAAMRQLLLNEHLETWLQDQLQRRFPQ
jgi:parvulin-like peptidyl-prolyl isomerase